MVGWNGNSERRERSSDRTDGDSPGEELHESYFQLVWQRFRKSRPAIAGGLMVLSLIILALFAEFFAPVDPTDANLRDSFIPPHSHPRER